LESEHDVIGIAHHTEPSGFLCSFIVGVCPWTSRRVPHLHQVRASTGPPGSRAKCFRAYTGSLTERDPNASRGVDAFGVAFRFSLQRRHPEERFFRGCILGPHVPLSTLRRFPLPEAPHDSGPSWVAGPLTCDSFIHNTSPV